MKVEILQCNGCGANISPNNTKCIYCQSINIVVSSSHPLNVCENQAKSIANYFKSRVSTNSTDGAALFSLGMFYLNLKLYDLAIKNFESAIAFLPDEPDVYYYYALSLIQGKRPKLLGLQQARKVEENLNTAIQLNEKAKYFCLAAIINFDFYASNGMKIPQPDYHLLLNKASSAEKEVTEIEVLLQNVIIRDENLISIIRNINY